MASRTQFNPLSEPQFPQAAVAPATSNANAPAVYRAGDQVPAPGTYWVWHSKHRAAHASKVRFPVFPACAHCGQSVRFLPAEETTAGLISDWLRRDPDFRRALERTRVRRRKKTE